MAYAKINGINLYYKIAGKGRAMIFIHGFKLDHRVMQLIAGGFSQKYKTVLLDLRGHGRSDKPKTGYSYDQLVFDLKELLDYLNIKEAILAGYSMGGELALRFSVEYPKYAAGLVLIATGLRYGLENIRTICASGRSEDELQNIPQARKKYEAVISPAKNLLPEYVKKDLSKELEAFDFRQPAAKIRVPVLILAGEIDTHYPNWIQYEMKEIIPDSQLEILKDCTHGVIFEKTKKCVEIINKFLKKNNFHAFTEDKKHLWR